MSRMILCESSAGWSTVVFSKFSVIDERNGVPVGPKILRTWTRKLVKQLSQLSFLWLFSS